jgi:hypothetical protein
MTRALQIGETVSIIGTAVRGIVQERRTIELKPGLFADYVRLEGSWVGEHDCRRLTR